MAVSWFDLILFRYFGMHIEYTPPTKGSIVCTSLDNWYLAKTVWLLCVYKYIHISVDSACSHNRLDYSNIQRDDGGGGGWNVTFYGSIGMNYVAAFLVFKPYS